MSVAAQPIFAFRNTFVHELPELGEPWAGAQVDDPVLLVLNGQLAAELGLDEALLQSPQGVAALAGSVAPEGAEPVAQAYAGHQFGGYSPRLGDGRALLLGEVLDARGVRQDVHLKGSGRTPFARGGDGKAAVGPMLREFAISSAMHALGIPTARALAVVATNQPVMREVALPGAVLTRIAESHLRVGTFEYAARRDPELLRRLADYAIARHVPHAAEADDPYLAFYAGVVAAQADLIARWMLVGFIHGVMNTDNMTISGQTIDYGPCAFLDRYDQATVFSSIDTGGRYAYGQQPSIAQWNLARLGETLVPLVAGTPEQAMEQLGAVLQGFVPRYEGALAAGTATKLALRLEPEQAADVELLTDELFQLLQREQPDFTAFFRALAASLREDRMGSTADDRTTAISAALPTSESFTVWAQRWRELLAAQGTAPAAAADAMDRVNPLYIPRNHLVEDALDAATAGDLAPFATMLEAIGDPFTERAGLEAWAAAPEVERPHMTFCGT